MKAQRDTWTDKRGYYFCNVVAVMPDMHGRGIGRKLVEVVTDQADKEGMKCYLESSKDVPNIQIYEKMGFEFARALECDDNGTVCKVGFYYFFFFNLFNSFLSYYLFILTIF